MRYTTIFVAALAIVAGRVAAQDDTTDTADATATDNTDATATDTSSGADATSTGIPACATTCGQQSTAQSTCTTKTDVNCLCADQTFLDAVAQCISTSCSEADQASAANFGDEFCANAGPVQSSSASASPAITSAAATSRAAVTPAASAATSARSSVSQSRSSASVVSASASHSGNAATAVKMPSTSFMVLGATALGFVVGPLLLFA